MLGPGATRLFLALVVWATHYAQFAHWSWVQFDGAAVYAFFFLSGYWIARLWDAKYALTSGPVLTFYISRIWRIWPICLLGTLAAVAFIPADIGTAAYNLIFVGPPYADPPLWSLAIEAQFYALAPLLLLYVRGNAWGVVLAVGAAGFATWVALGAQTIVQFICFFACGMIFARGRVPYPSASLVWGSLAALVGVIVALNVLKWSGGWDASANGVALRALNALFFVVALPALSWSLGQKSSAADRVMGDLAFPLFALHWPLWYAAARYMPDFVWPASIGLTLIVTAFVYLAIDRPSEAARRSFVAGRLRTATA